MVGRGTWLVRGVAVAVLLALSPAAQAATQTPKKRVATTARAFAVTAPRGTFTPAAADPRAAASFARAGVEDGAFRFTPSAAPGSRRAVTVAVRARRAIGQEQARTATALVVPLLNPVSSSAYNLGASVGWKRFALSGDVSRVDYGMMPGGREAADVALSYGGRNWSTRVVVGTERLAGTGAALVGRTEGYSVDLGGSYNLTRNLELSGGVRYRTQRDAIEPLADMRRDSQAVYLGTAFRF